MNFNKMHLREVSGLSVLGKLLKGNEIRLSKVSSGIDVLLVNGAVCKMDGVPYQNELLQVEFAPVAERIEACKCVGIAKITVPNDVEAVYGSRIRTMMDLRMDTKLASEATLEIEDICSLIAEAIPAKARIEMARGMVLGIKAITPRLKIKVQDYVTVSDAESAIASSFIEKVIESNCKLAVYSGMSAYSQGASTIPETNSFYLNPFQIIEARILQFKAKKIKNISTNNEELEILSNITVERNGQTHIIDYEGQQIRKCKFLLELLRAGKLKTMKFEAILNKGELSMQRPF